MLDSGTNVRRGYAVASNLCNEESVGYYITDLNGNIIYRNPLVDNKYRWVVQHLFRSTFDDAEQFTSWLTRCKDGEFATCSGSWMVNDKKTGATALVCGRILLNHDCVRAICLTIQDATVSDNSNPVILSSQRLPFTLEIAGDIAHHIRNPLTVVRGLTQLVREMSYPEYMNYHDIILQEVDVASAVIDDLLLIHDAPSPNQHAFDILDCLNAAVQETMEQKLTNTVSVKCSHGAIPVKCNREHIQRCLSQVLRFALQWSTSTVSLNIHAGTAENNRVYIEFIFRIPGVDTETPEYSTDDTFLHSDLRLRVAAEVIRSYGGTLQTTMNLQTSHIRLTLPSASPESADI